MFSGQLTFHCGMFSWICVSNVPSLHCYASGPFQDECGTGEFVPPNIRSLCSLDWYLPLWKRLSSSLSCVLRCYHGWSMPLCIEGSHFPGHCESSQERRWSLNWVVILYDIEISFNNVKTVYIICSMCCFDLCIWAYFSKNVSTWIPAHLKIVRDQCRILSSCSQQCKNAENKLITNKCICYIHDLVDMNMVTWEIGLLNDRAGVNVHACKIRGRGFNVHRCTSSEWNCWSHWLSLDDIKDGRV